MIKDQLIKDNEIIYIDVGASGGAIPKWKNFTENYQSVLFEPNENAYKDLIKNKTEKEIIINTALSNKKQNLIFNICKDAQASSFFKPNVKFLENYYNSERFKIIKQVQVQADTLDNQFKLKSIFDSDFLKIDVQGFELQILEGAIKSLDNIIGLEVEAEFVEIYNDQPLFSDIDNFLKKNNFYLFDIKRYYWKRKFASSINEKKGQLIFADTLYFKSPEYLISVFKKNKFKLIKSFYIYLFYGYSDLADIILKYLKLNKIIDINEENILQYNINFTNRSRFVLPDFFGKYFFKKVFQKLSNIFTNSNISSKNNEWEKNLYLGNDQNLGN